MKEKLNLIRKREQPAILLIIVEEEKLRHLDLLIHHLHPSISQQTHIVLLHQLCPSLVLLHLSSSQSPIILSTTVYPTLSSVFPDHRHALSSVISVVMETIIHLCCDWPYKIIVHPTLLPPPCSLSATFHLSPVLRLGG